MAGGEQANRSGRWLGHDLRELTIGRILAAQAAALSDKPFIRFLPENRTLTYAETEAASNRIANGLAARGIGHGSHVAVLAENSPEQILIFLALGKLGAVAVPINTAARGATLRYFLSHSDATAAFVDEDLLDRLADLGGEPALEAVFVLSRGSEVRFAPSLAKAVVPVSALLDASPEPPDQGRVRFSDSAFICYTSGTTGPSKGVVMTQVRALTWGLAHIASLGHRASDTLYVCLPLFHVNALQGSTYTALLAGATIALQRRFSASGFWTDIRSSGATVTNLLGSMVNILWNQPPSPADAENRLRMCYCTPAPSFGPAFETRFGLRIVSAYGLTDYGTTHSYSLIDPPAKYGSAGRARAGITARVVDEDDFDVPAGTAGELVLRHEVPWCAGGGYYKMPAETMASMRNGWFHTGDRCRIDEDGYLWFVDRLKDAIRRRGENVSAFEVEEILAAHPAVAEVAVYAVPSEMSEDEVAASVVLRDGHAADPEAIIRHCAREMPYFMVPRFLAFVDELPKNLTQKVEKFRLRQAALENRSDFWDREAAGIKLAR